ncbi:MAG: hypothetical protein MUO53_13355 [Maribacter sp.]|nr:hypothetical protein [Maribacter sp.]
MNRSVPPKKRYILYALLLTIGFCHAQAFSTRKTKVVLVMDLKSDVVKHLVLYSDFEKLNESQLLTLYPLSEFYIGQFNGSYEIVHDAIKPVRNSTIIMYTEKLFFPGEHFLASKDLLPGIRFDIGKIKAKIVAVKKGELIIKT